MFTLNAFLMSSPQAASAGLKDSEAIKYLEEKMSGNPSLSFEATSEVSVTW